VWLKNKEKQTLSNTKGDICKTLEDDMEEFDDQEMIVKHIHKKFNTKKIKRKPVQKSLDSVEFQMESNLSKTEFVNRYAVFCLGYQMEGFL
jgi:hypothetical protein